MLMKFNIQLTLEQINEIILCMREGPYYRVNNIISDLSRQCREQDPDGKGQPNTAAPVGQNGAQPGEKVQ